METTTLVFKALSEEPRLRILNLLLPRGELCVCDIMASLELPQSTASRHLAYLKKTRWVDDRPKGSGFTIQLPGTETPCCKTLYRFSSGI